MSNYSPLHKKIWRDKDFKKSKKDAKLLFLYLISNESINNSGIYEIPISTISEETGIGCPTVTQLLGNGSIKNIHYDLENEIVFVVNRRKHSPGGNPAQVEKGITSEFKQTSKTFLWNEFLKLNPQFKEMFSTVGQPLVNGTVPVLIPVVIKDLNNNKPLKMENEKKLNDNFEEDWERYPRKAGNKKKAESCYLKSVTSESKRQAFLAKMETYVASVEDPAYLQYGETFFRNWEPLVIPDKIVPPTKQTTGSRKLEQIQRLVKDGPGSKLLEEQL